MPKSFFFYDLETSGLSPQNDRIMQFAGQRTDLELNPIGDPYNVLVALSDDTLPSPDALMVTGITPQKTVEEGYSEAQFSRLLMEGVFTEDTIAVGFNNVRFDDEFIRHLFWRNFYDPYEWSWKDGRSRWDLLDVVRMTRALRPGGINWPVSSEGKPVNKLEAITKENGIAHDNAHDAYADVVALIEVASLIRQKQPQLFDYLLKLRDKREVQQLVNLDTKQAFVYTSGRYDGKYGCTTVAFPLTLGRNGNIVVYDLRVDPTPFIELSTAELQDRLFAPYDTRRKSGFVPVPVKELQYNRAPAVAPLSVLGIDSGWEKIGLDQHTVKNHTQSLLANPAFAERLRTAYETRPTFAAAIDPEARLYETFLSDSDKLRVETVRNATEQSLADYHPEFHDDRLSPLLLHYKARNFPRTLSEQEVVKWEEWRTERLRAALPRFMGGLAQYATTATTEQQFVLQELQLWAESILPADTD